MRSQESDPYAPCPCGSGKKYKFCCRDKDRIARPRDTQSWSHPSPGGDGPPRDVVVMDLDEGQRLNDEGVDLLGRGAYDVAKHKFLASTRAAPLMPAAHNNLAIVAFAQGDIEEAIRLQEETMRAIPIENMFGMANLVHFYLTAGRLADAEAMADRVMELEARDVSAIGKTCEVLARLGRHQAVLDTMDGWHGRPDDAVYFFAGVAAANLERYELALDYLTRVGRRSPHGGRAAKFSRLIREGKGPGTLEGNWPYFAPENVFPGNVMDRLVKEAKAGSEGGEMLKSNPALAEALAGMLNEYPDSAASAIEALGQIEHPRAVELLRKLAEGTFGTDENRLAAWRMLQSKGVAKPGERSKIWLRGKWEEVAGRMFSISPEAASAEIAPEIYPLYEKATITLGRGKWQEGEFLWRRVIEEAPDLHPAYHNLAVALMQQGRIAEAESHLRKAISLAPGYLFAPCTLAILCLQEGRAAEARQILDAVVVPEVVHPDAMACYCTTQTQVAATEGDYDKAVGWLDMAAGVAPDNPNVKALRRRLALPRRLTKSLRRAQDHFTKSKASLRRRVLPGEARLEDCYGAYTVMELAGMAEAIGCDLSAATRVEDVLTTVCSAFRDPDTIQSLLRGLEPAERSALAAVHDAGGRMDYEAFTRAHGTDAGDLLDWGLEPPKSVLGRLECRGLLVEAVVDRRESVFIPAELRAPAATHAG